MEPIVMKKWICLVLIVPMLASCLKEEEYFMNRDVQFTYSVESDCDTTYIEHLRYRGADLEWVDVFEPELPWSLALDAGDIDSTALEVTGFVANFGEDTTGTLLMKIDYTETIEEPNSQNTMHGSQDHVVYPASDTTEFTEMVKLKFASGL